MHERFIAIKDAPQLVHNIPRPLSVRIRASDTKLAEQIGPLMTLWRNKSDGYMSNMLTSEDLTSLVMRGWRASDACVHIRGCVICSDKGPLQSSGHFDHTSVNLFIGCNWLFFVCGCLLNSSNLACRHVDIKMAQLIWLGNEERARNAELNGETSVGEC